MINLKWILIIFNNLKFILNYWKSIDQSTFTIWIDLFAINKNFLFFLYLFSFFYRNDDESIRADTEESLLIPPPTSNLEHRTSNGNGNEHRIQRRPSSSVVSNVGSSENVEIVENVVGGGKSTKFENVGKTFTGDDSTDSLSICRPRFLNKKFFFRN